MDEKTEVFSNQSIEEENASMLLVKRHRGHGRGSDVASR
jgi:hypothetical protein